MKKFISLLVGVSFITFLFFGTVFAQEQSPSSTPAVNEPTPEQTAVSLNKKVGLNLKAFVGTGKFYASGDINAPEIVKASLDLDSKFAFPLFSFGISYTLPTIPLEFGFTYHRYKFKKLNKVNVSLDIKDAEAIKKSLIEDLEFTSEEAEEAVNNPVQLEDMIENLLPELMEDNGGTSPITQFSINITYTLELPFVSPYIGMDLFPFIEVKDFPGKYNPDFAISGTLGAKFKVTDVINLFAQGSFEKVFEKEIKDSGVKGNYSWNFLTFMLGFGVSL